MIGFDEEAFQRHMRGETLDRRVTEWYVKSWTSHGYRPECFELSRRLQEELAALGERMAAEFPDTFEYLGTGSVIRPRDWLP